MLALVSPALPAQATPLCFTTSVEVQLTDSCEVLNNTLGTHYTAVIKDRLANALDSVQNPAVVKVKVVPPESVATPKAAPKAAPIVAPIAAPVVAPVAAREANAEAKAEAEAEAKAEAAPIAAPVAAPIAAPAVAAPEAKPEVKPDAKPKAKAAAVAAPVAAPIAAPAVAAPEAKPEVKPDAKPKAKAAAVAAPVAAPIAAPVATPVAASSNASIAAPAPLALSFTDRILAGLGGLLPPLADPLAKPLKPLQHWPFPNEAALVSSEEAAPIHRAPWFPARPAAGIEPRPQAAADPAAETESQALRMRDSFWRQFPRSRSHMSLAQLAQSQQPAGPPGHGQTAADAATRAARRQQTVPAGFDRERMAAEVVCDAPGRQAARRRRRDAVTRRAGSALVTAAPRQDGGAGGTKLLLSIDSAPGEEQDDYLTYFGNIDSAGYSQLLGGLGVEGVDSANVEVGAPFDCNLARNTSISPPPPFPPPVPPPPPLARSLARGAAGAMSRGSTPAA